MKPISETYYPSSDGKRKYKFVTLECPSCGTHKEYQAAGAKRKQYAECPACRIKKSFTGTKVCTGCKKEKGLDAFTSTRKSSDGKYARCRKCRSEAAKISNSKTSKRDKYAKHASKMYNITKEEALSIRDSTDSCGICNKPLEWEARHLDHCHKTGKIRGILCGTCNRGLGAFYDNVESLDRAINWLRKHNDQIDNPCVLYAEVQNQEQ